MAFPIISGAALLTLMLLFLAMSNNPYFSCLILILVAIFTAIASALQSSKWVMVAIILIFLGGMMIIFLYACSLGSSNKTTVSSSVVFSIMALLVYFLWSCQSPSIQTASYSLSLTSLSGSFFILGLIGYLLLTLFLSVKIAESFKGSLVKKSLK